MNPQGTSFIPQRPTQGTIRKRGVRKVYILTYISFILFFGTILSTAGTFVYKTFENAQLDAQKKLLAEEREKFNEADMESVRELNRRMQNAQNLIDAHVSVVSIFTALEQSTLQELVLTGFDYKRSTAQVPTIALFGTTEAFNSILFQRTVLSSNPILKGASFTEVALMSEAQGENLPLTKNIAFTITADVQPDLIKFQPQDIQSTSEVSSLPAVDAVEATQAVPSDSEDATTDNE
jgi:hypothetical protein